MAKEITIDQLFNELLLARIKGLGKKKILLADDDEGNGYHPMYYSITPMTEFSSEGLDWVDLHGISPEDAKENYVILG